jgi:hypothetical protein
MTYARRLALVVLALASSALAVSAAPIIGSFSSTEDFFGTTFELQNDSAIAGLAGTFEDVLLQVNGASETVFDDEQVAASASLTDTFDTFTADGLLTFVFRPIGLPSQEYRLAFNAAVDPPVFFEYTADTGGSTPVPEPSSLLLLGIGAIAGLTRMKSWRAPRSSS